MTEAGSSRPTSAGSPKLETYPVGESGLSRSEPSEEFQGSGVKDKALRMKEGMAKVTGNLRERIDTERVKNETTDFIRRNPWASLLVGFGVGVAVGSLLFR